MGPPNILTSVVLTLLTFGLLSLLSLAIAAGTKSRRFLRLLIAYSAVLSVAVIASLASSLSSGTLGLPNLLGDGTSYYEQAAILAENGVWSYGETIRSNYFGYQVFLGFLFSVVGESLYVGLLANTCVLLVTLGVLYRGVEVATESGQVALYSCIAFALTPQFIYYAILLLKDPAIVLSFALVLLGLARLARRRSFGTAELLTLGFAFLVLGAMRGAYLPILAIETLLFIFLYVRKKAYLAVGIAVLAFILLPLVESMTTRTLDSTYMATTVMENSLLDKKFSGGVVDATGVVGKVSNSYSLLPFFLKVPLFVVPTGVQYLLPFEFWSDSFITDHTAYFFARNLNPIWFLFVGIWALYAVANVRHTQNQYVRHFLLFGAAFYATIAVIYAGVVPRYAGPALVFIYPAIGCWWAAAMNDALTRRHVRRFFTGCYIIFLAAAVAYVMFKFARNL